MSINSSSTSRGKQMSSQDDEDPYYALLSRQDALSSKSLRYEHISHLLCVDHSVDTSRHPISSPSSTSPDTISTTMNAATSTATNIINKELLEQEHYGTLITFQEGIKVGRAFENVRDRIRNFNSKIHQRGATHLLMQLVRASTESALSIEHYIEEALDRLQIQIRQHPDDIELVNFAKQIEIECETLQRVLEPFTETLLNLTKTREASLSTSVLGHNRAAWEDILLQQKRLDDNIEGEQQRAIDIVEGYRDSLARREEQVRE